MATETLLPRDDEDLGPSCATATSGTSGAPGPVPKVYTVCTSCNEQIIAGGSEQREHYRSERHMYNVKRKLEGAAPIPAEVWERKLQRFREIQQEQAKKTDHLKKGGNKNKAGGTAAKVESHITREKSGETTATSREDQESDSARPAVEQAAVDHALPPHRRCLFDHRSFKSLEDNLEYMKSKYSFTIPDRTYCSDKEGLLEFLHLKISKGHQCLYCDRAFKSAADCRQHMLDKNHTRIGLEGYTRKNNYSEELTLELNQQLEQFYDYRSSWKELNLSAKGKAKEEMRFKLGENIAEAGGTTSASAAGGKKEMSDAEKLAEMFDFFDEDEDGLLDFEEARDFAELILPPESADSFDELAYQKLAEESQRASPNPDRENAAKAEQDSFGVDLQTFARHFFSTGKCNSSIAATHEAFLDEYDIVEDGEDSVMDASTSHLSTSDTEFRVCENEDDFQRVCKALNLRVARVNEDTGNLQLPDGSEAAHRGLRYVYRQRGLHLYAGRRERTSAEKAKQKAIGGGFGARLALQNGGANCLVGISELKKQGKQIMAIQRKDMKKFMRQGIQQTIINRGRTITAMTYVR